MWSLLDLLATGSLGPVTPGSTTDAALEAFGAPTDLSRGRAAIVLKYGALEVTVADGRIELLHVEFDQLLPAFVRDAGLSATTTRGEVERMLAEHGVAFEPCPSLTFPDDQSAILVSGSVSVVFDEDERLAAISSSPARSA